MTTPGAERTLAQRFAAGSRRLRHITGESGVQARRATV
jgi:hypothetical protein